MKKLFKYSLVTIIGLLLLVIIAATLLIRMVNLNNFKPEIEQMVYQETARTLKLNGNISWKLYPNLGVTVKDVSLSNPQNFEVGNLVSLNSADISLALIPLFSKHVVLKTFNIDGLKLSLLKRHGKSNWSFAKVEAATPNTQNDNKPQPGMRLELSGFSFTHATVKYDDYDSNKHIALNDKKLLVDTDFMGGIKFNQDDEELSLKKVTLNYDDKLLADINFTLAGFKAPQYSGDLAINQLRVNELLSDFGTVNSQPTFLKSISLKLNDFHGDINSVELPNNVLVLNDSLTVNLANVKVVNFAEPKLSGTIDMPQFNFNKLLLQSGIKPIQLANSSWLNNCKFSTSFSATANSLNLPALKLTIGDTNIAGNLSFNSLKPLVVNENLAVDMLDLSDIADINGFKVVNRGISLSGSSNFSSLGVAGLTGRQFLKVANITVKGIDVNEMIHRFDKSINRFGAANGDVQKILVSTPEIINTVNKIQHEVTSALSPGVKDYTKTTNFGSLELNANINRGVVSPSIFKLSGSTMLVNGAGSVNLNNKALNYKANSRLVVAGINPIFSQLTLPMTVGGSINKPSLSFDWLSIQNQFLKYLLNKNKDKVEKVIKDNINQAVGEQIRKNIGNSNANKAVDEVSKNITNAIGNLFGGGK